MGFRKLTVRFRPIRKEIVSSMYNNCHNFKGILTWDYPTRRKEDETNQRH